MVNVLFFAQLREQLKTEQVKLDIATPCTVGDVQNKLLELNPEWQSVMEGRTLLAAVNQDMVSSDAAVNDNDEVAFFPPVTGG